MIAIVSSTLFSGWVLVSMFNNYIFPDSVAQSVTKIEVAANTNIDKNIPDKLYPCLPKQAQKLKLVSSVNSGKNSFFIVGIYQSPIQGQASGGEPNYQETLLQQDEVGCLIVIPKEKMGATSIVPYLPKGIACELSIQEYRQVIASVGGRKKFEESFLDQSNESPGDLSYYFPEDICAFNKLGVKVPSNLKVIQHIDELLDRKQN
jgi:hypothetical protein